MTVFLRKVKFFWRTLYYEHNCAGSILDGLSSFYKIIKYRKEFLLENFHYESYKYKHHYSILQVTKLYTIKLFMLLNISRY